MQFINKDGFMFWVQSSNRVGKKIHQFASVMYTFCEAAAQWGVTRSETVYAQVQLCTLNLIQYIHILYAHTYCIITHCSLCFILCEHHDMKLESELSC